MKETSKIGLLIAVALSIVVMLFLYPLTHPDSAVRYFKDSKPAEEQSAEFLSLLGIDTFSLVGKPSVYQSSEFLKTLQDSRGRTDISKQFSPDQLHVWPAYLWQTEYVDIDSASERIKSTEEKIQEVVDGKEADIVIRHSINGAILTYENKQTISDEPESILYDRLNTLFPDWQDSYEFIPDSLKVTANIETNPTRIEQLQGGNTAVYLSKDYFLMMADYWLSQTFWEGQTDSSQTYSINSDNQIRVSRNFSVDEDTYPVKVHVSMSSLGSLQSIATEWAPANETQFSSSSTSNTVVITSLADYPKNKSIEAINIIGYILLSILIIAMFVIFIRRYLARLIDTRNAYGDAAFGFMIILLGSSLPILYNLISGNAGSIWVMLLLISGTLFISLFSGIKFFLLAGVAVSVSHESHPKSIAALNILRRGFVMNQPVGTAMMRGLTAGTIVSGIICLVAVIFYQAPAITNGGVISTGFSAFLTDFSEAVNSIIYIYLMVFGVFLTIGLALYNRVKNWNKITTFLFFILLFWNVNQVKLESVGFVLLANAVLAIGWIYLFRKFDALTLCFGLLVYFIWMKLLPGFIPGGWLSWHLIIFSFVLIGGLIIGYRAIKYGPDLYDIPDYTPAYILERTRRERIEQELQIARQVQENFLPRKSPNIEGIQVVAQCTPAFEIGGDYFDFIRIDEKRTGIIIGDVSGKGIQAAFYVTLVKGFVQSLCCDITHPGDLMIKINSLFRENVPRGTFITMLYGIYDREACTFTFVRAGHDPLMLLSGGDVKLHRPNGLPLGMADKPLFEANLEVECIELKKGDAAILFTDGYTETRNRRGEFFGDERLKSILKNTRILSANDIMDRMSMAIQTFRGDQPQHDDVTTVVMFKT